MSNTLENLGTAFSGESQANHRYLFFADKAEREGYPQIAKLFRATAEISKRSTQISGIYKY